MSAMPETPGVLRAGGAGKACRLSSRGVLGSPGPGIRRPARPHAGAGVGPGGARSQPHGPGIHRGRFIGLPDAGNASSRLREHADLADCQGRAQAEGCLHQRRRSLRPAREQADHERDRQLPRLSRIRADRSRPGPGRGRPGEGRVRRLLAAGRRPRRRAQAKTSLRAWAGLPGRWRACPRGLFSP